jgi:hypothetical protein
MTATVEGPKVAMAFQKPGTPCERAWADLFNEIPNERVEQVIASLGGWEVMIDRPITFRQFSEAFNDSEPGTCSVWKAGSR